MCCINTLAWGAYHLAKKTGIFGWKTNGKVDFPGNSAGTSGQPSEFVLRFLLE